jgi:hypothetical protein
VCCLTACLLCAACWACCRAAQHDQVAGRQHAWEAYLGHRGRVNDRPQLPAVACCLSLQELSAEMASSHHMRTSRQTRSQPCLDNRLLFSSNRKYTHKLPLQPQPAVLWQRLHVSVVVLGFHLASHGLHAVYLRCSLGGMQPDRGKTAASQPNASASWHRPRMVYAPWRCLHARALNSCTGFSTQTTMVSGFCLCLNALGGVAESAAP